MLMLDENLPASQQRLLRKWRIRFRLVGGEVASWGTGDENLIPALHRLAQPTFFTLDRDFHRRDWAHAGYCLVWLDVPDDHAADFIRRFLRHPAFDIPGSGYFPFSASGFFRHVTDIRQRTSVL